MRYGIVLVASYTAILHFALARAADSDDVPSAAVKNSPVASPTIFRAAVRGLEQYRDTRPYKAEWNISSSPSTGIIETNWYPDHKGEVRLKIQIAVWGDSFRVDAWQKMGLVVPSVTKTDWSRNTERLVQNAIESQLRIEKAAK